MVEYVDGSVLAQISATDMRMPIQYALTYPDRKPAAVPRLRWDEVRKWEFYPPDHEKFPLLRLSYQAHEAGGSATCTLNAADEIAVEAFLRGEISFPGIGEVVEETLGRVGTSPMHSVADVMEADGRSREVAHSIVKSRGRNGVASVLVGSRAAVTRQC
jgi:1-deoxy-D-xylulose-5-phosphate reductoisomerase